MDSLIWITLGGNMIGFVVLGLIKKYMESKKNSTTQSRVWFIVGTTVWGGVFCMDAIVNQGLILIDIQDKLNNGPNKKYIKKPRNQLYLRFCGFFNEHYYRWFIVIGMRL